jgi:protein-S-isoprenylcysteine O-methyltransferase Ste14
MAKDGKAAGVIAFPPLIYGIPLALSLGADYFLSSRRLPAASRRLSAGFFSAAAALVIPAFREFKKAGTAVDPFEETIALVQTGPFAYTRNPFYSALTLVYCGVTLATRRTLPLALLPAILWVMNAGVIEREERYLEQKFGEAYREYMLRVPRWF